MPGMLAGQQLKPSDRTHLRPASARLLPPTSGAFLDIGDAAAAEAAVARLQALTARAASSARVMAERAADAAKEHRPEIERRAREAAAATSLQAGRLAARATVLAADGGVKAREALGDRDRRSQLLATHKSRLAAGGAAVAVLACLVWMVGNQATGNAVHKQVEAALDTYHLRGVVHYRTLATSMFGNVALEGVSISIGGLLVRADDVRVSRIDMSSGLLQHLALKADGITVPVLQMARQDGWPVERSLVGLGYTAPRLDAALDLRLDQAEQIASLHMTGNVAALGSWDLTASFGGFGPQALHDAADAIRVMNARDSYAPGSGFMRSDFADPRQVIPGLEARLTLRDASLTLEDSDLVRRLHVIPAASVPDDAAEAGPAEPGRNEADRNAVLPPDLVEQLHQSMSETDASAAEQTLRAWIVAGGELTVRAAPTAPIPLFRTGDFGGEPVPATNDPGFLGSLNLQVRR